MASGGRHGLAQSLFQVGGNFGTSLGPLLAAFIIGARGHGGGMGPLGAQQGRHVVGHCLAMHALRRGEQAVKLRPVGEEAREERAHRGRLRRLRRAGVHQQDADALGAQPRPTHTNFNSV